MTIEEYKKKKEELLYKLSNGLVKSENDCIKPEWCSVCKGGCCKSFPCTFSPEDFIDITNINYMKNLLETGVIVIAPLNIMHDLYCIRVKGEKDLDSVVTGYTQKLNSCLLYTEKGCMLEYVFRPSEGLLLVPGSESVYEMCDQLYDIEDLKKDWSHYQTYLKRLMKECKNMIISSEDISQKQVDCYKKLFLNPNVNKNKKGAK
ncbi:MAG: hypothetical protein IKE10_01765 [Bacilli bacterium]|nr:hypothetical protein [Bacilli bacterium]